MSKRNVSITSKILVIASSILIAIVAAVLIAVIVSVNSVTDSMMLNVTQVNTRTASQNASKTIDGISDRLALARTDDRVIGTNATAEDMNAFLESVLEGSNFNWLALYDHRGARLAGNAENTPESILGRSIFPILSNQETLGIENTSLNHRVQEPEIVMGLLIRRDWLLGDYFLAGGYSYDVFAEMLYNIRLGDNSIAFIISNGGALIIHSCDSETIVDGDDIAAILGGGSEVTQVILSMRAGVDGARILSSQNGARYIGYTPIEGTPWSLAVVTYRSDFTTPFNLTMFVAITIVAVILIAAVIIFRLLLLRVLSNPLHKITESASLMARGRFDTALLGDFKTRDDEIG